MRKMFVRWLFRASGIAEGQVLPRWARLCLFLAFPSRMMFYMGSGFYDLRTDCFAMEGTRFSRQFFESLSAGPYPTPWWRVKSRSGDSLVVERMEPPQGEP